MVFALLFIAVVVLIPFVLWTWVYISAFLWGTKQARGRKGPTELELQKLGGELEEARTRLLDHPRSTAE